MKDIFNKKDYEQLEKQHLIEDDINNRKQPLKYYQEYTITVEDTYGTNDEHMRLTVYSRDVSNGISEVVNKKYDKAAIRTLEELLGTETKAINGETLYDCE